MGLSASLAGEPIVLRLMDAEISSVVVESRREHAYLPQGSVDLDKGRAAGMIREAVEVRDET